MIGAMTADEEVLDWIEQMRADVAAGPEIYRPGAFWDELIAKNLDMIEREGIDRLKRTVSNNYYNWLVIAVRDPQLLRAASRWLRRPGLSALRTSVGDATGLRTTSQADSVGLSPKAARIYGFFVGALWDLAVREDSRDLTRRLREPAAGGPVPIVSRGRPISQDLANSIIEFSFVDRKLGVAYGARVAELGAGYGRLAYVYAEAGAAYCVADIPPALAVSQWYLREVLGRDRLVAWEANPDPVALAERMVPGTVAFLTPAQLELLPDGFFDLTQTVSTLPEMPAAQAEHFLELLLAKSSRGFFLKQWMDWTNDADGAHCTEHSYDRPADWELVARRADPVQPAFFDQVWRKRS